MLELLSKIVGYGIIVPAFVIQVPQILAVWRSWSVDGLSLASYVFDLFLIVISIIYNLKKRFPLNAWGEALPVALQLYVLITLILWISKGRILAICFLLSSVGVLNLILNPSSVDLNFLWYLNLSFNVMAIGSKVVQVMTNFRSGSTGQLSLVPILLGTGGIVIRIFTTIMETGDALGLVFGSLALIVHILLVTQVIVYSRTKLK